MSKRSEDEKALRGQIDAVSYLLSRSGEASMSWAEVAELHAALASMRETLEKYTRPVFVLVDPATPADDLARLRVKLEAELGIKMLLVPR